MRKKTTKDQCICQPLSLTELRQWCKLRNLQPKTSQTFHNFSAEVQLVLENWLKEAKDGRDFKNLKDVWLKIVYYQR